MAISDSTVVYKRIPGFLGYAVGSDGSVWSQRRHKKSKGKWKRLRSNNRSGRLEVYLYDTNGVKHGLPIHRLVLTVFVGPCPEGMEACHFPDRDPTNNNLNNLRWDTRSNNHKDKVFHGTDNRGEKNPQVKLTKDQVSKMRLRYASGECSINELAKEFNVNKTTAGEAIKRITWSWLEEDENEQTVS